MNLKPYIPEIPAIVREVVIVLIGTVGAAWIISQVPALQRLVRGNSVPSPLDN